MNVAFFTPPPEQRVGGLDAAINGLREALGRRGVQVDDNLADLSGAALVHFHGLWQPNHARLARKCAARGLPYIVSPHGMLEPWALRHKRWKKWPYFHLIEKRHLHRAQSVLATAPAEARRLGRFLPRQRIDTLPLGLTGRARPDYDGARRHLGWPTHERVLLFLSRLHEKKGLDLLLRALASHPRQPDVRLAIVGDGKPNFVQSLKALARSLAADLPAIEWHGGVWGDARWPFFQGADLFCLPTHSENFGLAVLEACQVGTPVLTTTATPWAESLSAEVSFIGEPTVDSVREMLAQFFARPRWKADDRQRFSEWAWREFDWEVLAGKYLALYAALARAM